MTFDEWWAENSAKYSEDALHMSEYHMARIVWEAAQKALMEWAIHAKQGKDET